MRIHVTGNAAAGKTTLAKELAGVLDLPFFSVDSVIWLPGWKQPPKDERSAAILALAQQPSWVIDGVAASLREHADLVIVLDVPPHVCALRGLLRCLRYGRTSRPGFPPGCAEFKIAPTLMRIIFSFPTRAGAAIAADAAQAPERYRVLSWPSRPDEGVSELARWVREKIR